MYKIIDFHCHVFPGTVAQKATDNVGRYYGLAMHGNGTAANLVRNAKGINVKSFLVHSSATKAAQVESVNNFIAGYVKNNNMFIGFGSMHKEYEHIEEEMKRMKSIGLSGLKLHPDFQGFVIDEQDMLKIYEIAEYFNMPLLFHVGDENTDASSPKRLSKILDIFPKLRVVAAHMGGYSAWDEAIDCLYGKNLYFDTSSTMHKVPYERMREMIYMHGADKILFGSDYPIQTTPEAYEDILKLRLPDEDMEKILHKNAEKFLGL